LSGKHIVDDLDLSLPNGKILTLLGPSGSGKTTMLRLAVGLERCRAGRISYGNTVVDEPARRLFVKTEKRDVGMIFQSYALWPHMSVFDNVAFPLAVRKMPMPQIRSRVDEALELVGLRRESHSGVARLSGGQQQRVAVARALVSRPALLFADEPFSNLDANLKDQMRVELKTLQRALGFSVLFVTHDQSEALALSDQLALVRDGRIEQQGTSTDIYARPHSPFVRDFIGSWLRLKCEIEVRERGAVSVKALDGRQVWIQGADHSAGARGGTPGLVTIRQEHLEIRPESPSQAGSCNEIPGIINTLLFRGATFEASVRLPDGAQVLITLPAVRDWREQQRIVMHLPPGRTQLWPAA
jgi:iron(III) transport system ATP-binding protein